MNKTCQICNKLYTITPRTKIDHYNCSCMNIACYANTNNIRYLEYYYINYVIIINCDKKTAELMTPELKIYKIPFFYPDLSDYPKFINKINTITTFF